MNFIRYNQTEKNNNNKKKKKKKKKNNNNKKTKNNKEFLDLRKIICLRKCGYLTFQNDHWYVFHTIAEHGMRFIPLQKWYDIILCCHSNRLVPTLMVSLLKECNLWYKFQSPSCYGSRSVYSFHSWVVWNAYRRLQWYEMHTSANFEKSKTHIFSNK